MGKTNIITQIAPINMLPDPQILKAIISTEMPYGKYQGRPVCDLPVHYLEWMKTKGFPAGKLGMLLSTVYEIKTNGLDEIIQKLKSIK